MVSNAKELSRLCKELEDTKISIASVFRIFNEVVSNIILFRRAGYFHVVAIAMPDGWVVDIV